MEAFSEKCAYFLCTVVKDSLTLSGRVSRIRDKQKKKKNLPTVGFEPESHGCKSSTLTTRPPKPVLIGITKMYL